MGSLPPLWGPGLGASGPASATSLSSPAHSNTGRSPIHPPGTQVGKTPSLKKLAADKQGFEKGREKSRHICQPPLQVDPGATPLASSA